MPVKISVSEFQPVKEKLTLYDDYGNPIEGADDVWVILIPPTFREDKQRGDLLRSSYSSAGAVSLTNPRVLQAEEIWLTFGGTNLEIELPKLDENGQVEWRENAEGELEPKTEIVAFPKNGKSGMTKQEFMDALDRLPDYIVHAWHNLVITKVARGWALPF